MTVPKTYKDYSSNSSVQLQSIWKDSRIMTDVKLQLLTIVLPVLLYAAETWTVNKEDEKDLRDAASIPKDRTKWRQSVTSPYSPWRRRSHQTSDVISLRETSVVSIVLRIVWFLSLRLAFLSEGNKWWMQWLVQHIDLNNCIVNTTKCKQYEINIKHQLQINIHSHHSVWFVIVLSKQWIHAPEHSIRYHFL